MRLIDGRADDNVRDKENMRADTVERMGVPCLPSCFLYGTDPLRPLYETGEGSASFTATGGRQGGGRPGGAESGYGKPSGFCAGDLEAM